jgi:serine/threonine protein kinase/Flp pilus assembly protein TadD
MDSGILDQNLAELDAFVAVFEVARERAADADLAEFLPPASHPLYRLVLRELVRVDLEYGWKQGRPRPLEDYRRRFPELVADPDGLREIAFEEHRLRLQASERIADTPPAAPLHAADVPTRRLPTPQPEVGSEEAGAADLSSRLTPVQQAAAAYQSFRLQQEGASGEVDSWFEAFRGSAVHAGFFRDVHRRDPEAAARIAEAVTSLPEVGKDFLGFRLLGELGQGSFGRVYLARQGELANRLVALKVSSAALGESCTLAQLQHTHIVPIYSIHRAGPFQAVCMPYFGATTLADVFRDLAGRATLPDSGKGLTSTLNERKAQAQGSTAPGVRGQESGVSSQESVSKDLGSPAPDSCLLPPAQGKSTATLEMLEALSYVDSVLWIGACLADGLAHAHERGILHRDLKPANILLTDEGQPMLLDFNLSEDTKLRGSLSGAYIGGTLPYMAPEHLEAIGGGALPVDARSDVYALGLILYELLTRRHPFAVGRDPSPEMLAKMIEERHRPPLRLRRWNRAVSPAVEAIVRRCLEPDPSRRYQTARQLQEDLERQRESRPLKHTPEPSPAERCAKWMRRHPRLTSSASMAVLAGGVILALGLALVVHKQRLDHLEAQDSYRQFEEQRRNVTFLLNSRSVPRAERQVGVELCRATLEIFLHPASLRVPVWQERTVFRNLSSRQQQSVRQGAGELLLLLARATLADAADQPESGRREEDLRAALGWNELAETCFAGEETPSALWSQRAGLARLLGEADRSRDWAARAGGLPPRTGRDLYLAATEEIDAGRFRDALAHLQQATRLQPQDFCAWFARALCHDRLGQDADAVHCYDTALALWPGQHWLLYFNRGLAHLRRRDFDQAGADFDQAIQLRPDQAEPYLNRALARQGQGRLAAAIADLTRALELGSVPTRVYFMRAVLRQRAGDDDGARRDREVGMRQEPTDELSWVARGVARVHDDPDGALADFEQALRLNPRSLPALQNKAHVLSQKPGRLQDAAGALDRALEFYPDAVETRSGRGVLLARLGKVAEARQDAETALLGDPSPRVVYQVTGIYALTSKTSGEDDARKALQLLSSALRQGFGFDLLDRDRELDPIRDRPEFRRVVDAARALSGQAGGGP